MYLETLAKLEDAGPRNIMGEGERVAWDISACDLWRAKSRVNICEEVRSRVSIYLLVALAVPWRRMPDVHYSKRLTSPILCLALEPLLYDIADVIGCREAAMRSGGMFVVLCLTITWNCPSLQP